MKIVPLDGGVHERNNFDCGRPYLNNFLQQQAQQAAKRYGSKTFVLVQDDDQETILGYHTTLFTQIDPAVIPQGRLGRGPIPMLLLARFAVDSRVQGKGFGKILLIDVLRRAKLIADNTALYGVVLDAIDDDAQKFYLKFGFKALTDSPRRLYMPIGTILELLSDENS